VTGGVDRRQIKGVVLIFGIGSGFEGENIFLPFWGIMRGIFLIQKNITFIIIYLYIKSIPTPGTNKIKGLR
jgi:hypothetical protein